jgi:ankyrin repeat protein
MQAGANPNIKAGGATPLHIAADSRHIELINCLLKAGGDPNAYDDVSCIPF